MHRQLSIYLFPVWLFTVSTECFHVISVFRRLVEVLTFAGMKNKNITAAIRRCAVAVNAWVQVINGECVRHAD